MAISVLLFFRSSGDVRKIYDAIVGEMRIQDAPPRGAIYHWCAPVSGGMQICDIWETREDFDRFAEEKIRPLSAKHGFSAPTTDIMPLHERLEGRANSRKGAGFFIEWDGDTQTLLQKVDDANVRMNVVADPPDGLVMHWTAPSRTGIRVVDHWRSREDFERFVQSRLAQTMDGIGMPQPRVTQFEVYNTIDPRVTART